MKNKIEILIFLIFILSLLDALFTSLEMVYLGVEELNPIMNYAILFTGVGEYFIAFKIIIATFSCCLLHYIYKRRDIKYIVYFLFFVLIFTILCHFWILLIMTKVIQ